MDRLHRFVNLLSVATADGSLSEREIKFLSQRAREWGLSDHQFAIAVNRSLEHPGEFEIPRRRSEREELLRDMLRIMAADGRLQDVEKQLFAIVAAHMKFSAAQIDAIIVDLASQVPPKLPPIEPPALPPPAESTSAASPASANAKAKANSKTKATKSKATKSKATKNKATKNKATKNKVGSKKSAKSPGAVAKPAKARKKTTAIAARKKKGTSL